MLTIRFVFCTVLFITLPSLFAADPIPSLFEVAAGSAIVDGVEHGPGSTVAVAAVVSTGEGAVRLRLLGADHGHIYVAPHSSLRGEELSDGGKWALRLVIGRGLVQVDADALRGSGFDSLLVRGGVSEAEMTGTLFVVQRIRRDEDYVALVRGGLRVRDTVAAVDRAIQRRRELDLQPGQSIIITADDGFGEVVSFAGLPVAIEVADAFAAVTDEDVTGGGLAKPGTGNPWFSPARSSGESEILQSLNGLEFPIGFGSIFNNIISGIQLEMIVVETSSEGALQVLADPPPPPPEPN